MLAKSVSLNISTNTQYLVLMSTNELQVPIKYLPPTELPISDGQCRR